MKFILNMLAVLLIVVGSAGAYRHLLENSLLLEQSPLEEARALAEQGQLSQAQLWSNWVIERRPDLGSVDEAKALLVKIDEKAKSTRVGRFAKGMVTGEADDLAGLLGTLSLDLFVIGDIRDIIVQSYKELTDDSGDMIILALSSVGLATTILPEADWVPSLLKSFKRSGVMTKGFTKSLGDVSKAALKTGDFKVLSKIIGDTGSAAVKLGPSGLKGSMKAVGHVSDVGKLSKAAKIDPQTTYVLASKFGSKGLSKLNKNGSNITAVASKIKLVSRSAKIVKKAVPVLPFGLWLVMIGVGVSWLFRRKIIKLPFVMIKTAFLKVKSNFKSVS